MMDEEDSQVPLSSQQVNLDSYLFWLNGRHLASDPRLWLRTIRLR
jgi:hypothetical protein